MDNGRDVELARAIAAGEVDALSRAYDAYGVQAFSVAFRVLGDVDRAEDVVYDCFVDLWNSAGRHVGQGSLRAKLMAAARNASIDSLRGRAREDAIRADRGAVAASAAAGALWADAGLTDVRDAVRQGLGDLPIEQRQAVELACFSGYSCREIAAVTHSAPRRVKASLRGALERIDSHLRMRGLVNGS